ncbi:hypothetical protein [Lentibacillus daqui]|uniref:hypothetical protein n=1 Tax=Lentibacillus daqui TaxID=2911514 RepID=UPI0022B18FB9|nr:hypothetical protein [Lentibacillus daqui]
MFYQLERYVRFKVDTRLMVVDILLISTDIPDLVADIQLIRLISARSRSIPG